MFREIPVAWKVLKICRHSVDLHVYILRDRKFNALEARYYAAALLDTIYCTIST